jgi:hypothetical protein
MDRHLLLSRYTDAPGSFKSELGFRVKEEEDPILFRGRDGSHQADGLVTSGRQQALSSVARDRMCRSEKASSCYL